LCWLEFGCSAINSLSLAIRILFNFHVSQVRRQYMLRYSMTVCSSISRVIR
jgi:hypothetical protein